MSGVLYDLRKDNDKVELRIKVKNYNYWLVWFKYTSEVNIWNMDKSMWRL